MLQRDNRNDLSSTTMMTSTLFSGPVISTHTLSSLLYLVLIPAVDQSPCHGPDLRLYGLLPVTMKEKGETMNLPGHQGVSLALSAPQFLYPILILGHRAGPLTVPNTCTVHM